MRLYRLLGALEVDDAGRRVELGAPKQRAVLAALLLDAGRVVPSDRLVACVWGDRPPPNVPTSLQVYVSNLRRLLRDEARATSPIARQPPGYRIDVDPDDVDVSRFLADCTAAQLALDNGEWDRGVTIGERAMAWWRGPLLSEFADEEWVRVAAAALDERRWAVEETLVSALLGAGRTTDAVSRSGRLHAEQPLRERGCWLAMMALHRAGRGADALELYRRHAALLDAELGLDPGAALGELQVAILRRDPELQRWPSAAAAVASPPPETPADPSSADPFVGRAREIAILGSALAQARTGGARWVVLEGEAGIGKSRLAEEVARGWARDGGAVARARCPDDDGLPNWWPLRHVLRDLGVDPDPVLAVVGGTDADTARFVAYDRLLTRLTDAAHARPLLVVIDDVQWVDPSSLRFLTHLAEAADVPGLAVVLTLRDSPRGVDTGRLLAAIARRTGSRQLTVPPLAPAEVADLAARVSGQTLAEDRARELADRTGGNPFFVCEFARLLDEERERGLVPAAVRSVLDLRLARLDPAVLQVLRAAAILGETLDVALLADVTRLAPVELADLLDDAADEHLIAIAPGRADYAFTHALLRDAVLAGLSEVRRRRLHLRAAHAFGSAVGDRLAQRAAHLVAALPLADPQDALDACRAAAEHADTTWQSDTAAHWWAAAIEVFDRLASPADLDRDELVLAQVAALARAGRSQTVLETVDAALLDAARDGRTASVGRLAATLLRTAGSWPWVVHGSDPGPLLAHLAGLEGFVRGEVAAHVRVLAALAVDNVYDLYGQLPETLGTRAVRLAEEHGDPEVLADALLGRALALCGIAHRVPESLAVLDRLAATPHALSPVDEVISDGLWFDARMAVGDPRAADHVRRGALGSDLLRMPVTRLQMRWAEAELQHWSGADLEQARLRYDEAWAAHRRTELYGSNVHDIAMLGLYWDQGLLSEHPELVDRLPWARALVMAARGDPAADTLIAAELARPAPVLWTTHPRLTMLAHAVADRGLRAQAAELRPRLEPLAHCVANWGQVGVVGVVALGLARLCAVLDDLDAARAHLATAYAVTRRARGGGTLVRCRLLALQLDAQQRRPVDVTAARIVPTMRRGAGCAESPGTRRP